MQNSRAKYLSFLMLIMLIISTMVPFFAVYNPQPSTNAKEFAELFGGKVLICTQDGFRWVSIEDFEHKKEHKPSEHYKCPLCYIAAKNPKITLSSNNPGTITEQKDIVAKVLYPQYHYTARPKSIAANIQSRAPPFSFVI